MTVSLIFDPALAAYDLGPSHPLRPERFTLAVELMHAYGLLGGETGHAEGRDSRASVIRAAPVPDTDLELVHDADYIATVKEAGSDPRRFRSRRGVGPGDTPAFGGMHEASALVAGCTSKALDEVLAGDSEKSFSVAGGLHHAHRDRAAGFCVYNDPAIAIARATRDRPGLRVAYVDIDAHHGDGVEEAFYDRDDVLTLSVHESGRYLYPGTGTARQVGIGRGVGYSVNVPMPPGADDMCYQLVFDDVISPALRAYGPDVIVAQCGADAHRNDPLTHLMLTVRGHRDLVDGLVSLADELCEGRIVCTGGGGYDSYSAVPRAWCNVLAAQLGLQLPEPVPEDWRREASRFSGTEAPRNLSEETIPDLDSATQDAVRNETVRSVAEVARAAQLLSG